MRIESVLIPALRLVLKNQWVGDRIFGFDSWGNPFDPALSADPYLIVDRVRADGPVVYKGIYRQWFVSGYEEVKAVLASPHALSQPQFDVMLDVRPYTKLEPHARSFLQNFMVALDAPAHGRLRGLVNRAFTPRQVAGLDARMDAIIEELIDDLDPSAPDVVNGFNVPFPVHVISELLGVPRERWTWVQQMSATIIALLDAFRGFDADVMNAELAEFRSYVLELAAERRSSPRYDLMTGLALAEMDGERLSQDELVSVFGLILFAGHETTAGMFGNALVALERFPDQRQWIRERPDRWPDAVEELIRYDTPVRSDPRAAAQDIEVGGFTIPAGANIALLLAMANRDERRYRDPDKLQLDRPDVATIAFGHGVHYCLGANLARMELRKGLHRLIDVLGDYTIDAGACSWKDSFTVRGPLHLAITPG